MSHTIIKRLLMNACQKKSSDSGGAEKDPQPERFCRPKGNPFKRLAAGWGLVFTWAPVCAVRMDGPIDYGF
jgi:hypothetical protein